MFAAMAVAAVLMPAGCGKQPPRRGVIGVSVLTMTNPFFCDMVETMKEEAAQHNLAVIPTAGEYDVARQKDQIDDFIVKQVAAIILCPCDSKAIGTSIAEANKAGIPVFTADIACLAEGPKVVCHVASDNEGGGREAAKAMIEALGGSGKIAILDFPEVESVLMRTKGFKEEIAKAPRIEIVAQPSGGGDKKKSSDATEDLLQSHAELDGIFAINDPSALGVVAAIEKVNKAGRIKIVGFDAMPEGRQGVRQGKLYATITQDPAKIARTVIDAVARYLDGEPVEPQILIPCTIYRKADADADPTLATAQ
jgi:ribose transport system substrate-binding protein